MDFSTSPLQQIPLLLLFLLPLLVFFRFFLSKRRKLPFPPGPPPLPIIGNMLMMDQLTHRGLAKLAQRYGGLFYLRLGFLHTVTVSTPEMARQVLQVQDNLFSNRPATIAVKYLTYDRADMAFAHYGPFWRQMRKLCVMKLFSRKRAESWASVRDEVESTLRSITDKAGSAVDIGEQVFSLTRNIIYRAAFGSTSHEGQDKFVSILQEFSKLMGAFNIADFIPLLSCIDPQGLNKRMINARQTLDSFIDRIIDDHMEKRKVGCKDDDEDTDMVDDLLAYLTEAGDDKASADDLQATLKLSRDNIKAIIMDVMFGGTETVASAIEWAMAEMMKRPDEMKKVQQELVEVVGLDRTVHESDLEKLPYLKCAMKETLRLHPPIPLLLHETAEDSEIAGYFIPARTRVTVNAWAIGRDKTAWEDADVFKPSRFAKEGAVDFKGNYFELIPFGSGRRSCPGMQLGLYALELAVAQLIHCFNWTLPDGMKPSELDMNDVFGLTAPKAIRLVAIPTPRLHCNLF
ncbi:cytochrome P450 84A1-like [Magnolia sinica]|uniref:cytochrome P450 84A1-like n=1 Tax=Magnolia sinica TaxID=86752 RepID=UPI00265A414F|nr:cytochrome P450 84A1-like [Magnolia sinica]